MFLVFFVCWWINCIIVIIFLATLFFIFVKILFLLGMSYFYLRSYFVLILYSIIIKIFILLFFDHFFLFLTAIWSRSSNSKWIVILSDYPCILYDFNIWIILRNLTFSIHYPDNESNFSFKLLVTILILLNLTLKSWYSWVDFLNKLLLLRLILLISPSKLQKKIIATKLTSF